MEQVADKTDLTAAAAERGSGLRRLTLAAQFLIAGSVVLLSGMVIIGFWVTSQIEEGVTRNTAAATALYMESFVAPRVQGLATNRTLSPAAQQELDKLLRDSELGRRIVSFKIWKEGGFIAYSSRPAIIGKTFPVTPNLRGAWQGHVTAEFDTLVDEEDALERAGNKPLLEMYSPIRDRETGRIIAVAEFYETADELKANLFQVRLQSWLVVGVATLVMLLALSGIVLRGSRTIEQQRTMLQRRVEDLSTLLKQNEDLRGRLQASSNRVAEINERYLRRIGADLHDGPAQLISFALLRLDSLKAALRKQSPDQGESRELDAIHNALREAMGEIREVCAGLTLAKLEEMSPLAVLREIVGSHERRTGTAVRLTVESIPETLALPLKISVFRFVQEGLNNAYRHAGGAGQKVTCRINGPVLELEVSDSGPGFSLENVAGKEGGLGLVGLRERIESLGGKLEVRSVAGDGTRLVMRCRLSDGE